MTPKLTVRNLNKSFGDKQVLKNVSFDVMEGEFLSVLGSSGCGKTTLLRILIGLTPPDSGEILLDGRDLAGAGPSERSMGIVFQNHALFENMSAVKNVSYALRFYGYSGREAKQLSLAMLEKLGLSREAQEKPARLSLGQQQRVAIARTLVLRPDILLLDEPLASLDADNRVLLRREIRELQKESRTTILYVTHDQEEAFAASDRVMVLHGGCLEQIASPREIWEHPATPYVEQFVNRNLRLRQEAFDRLV